MNEPGKSTWLANLNWYYVMIGVLVVLFVVALVISLNMEAKIYPMPDDDDYMSKEITIKPNSSATIKLFVPQGFCLEDNVYVMPTAAITASGSLTGKLGTTKGAENIGAETTLFSGNESALSNAYYMPNNEVGLTCAPTKDRYMYLTLTSTYDVSIKVIVKNEVWSIYDYINNL